MIKDKRDGIFDVRYPLFFYCKIEQNMPKIGKKNINMGNLNIYLIKRDKNCRI